MFSMLFIATPVTSVLGSTFPVAGSSTPVIRLPVCGSINTFLFFRSPNSASLPILYNSSPLATTFPFSSGSCLFNASCIFALNVFAVVPTADQFVIRLLFLLLYSAGVISLFLSCRYHSLVIDLASTAAD